MIIPIGAKLSEASFIKPGHDGARILPMSFATKEGRKNYFLSRHIKSIRTLIGTVVSTLRLQYFIEESTLEQRDKKPITFDIFSIQQ